MRRPSRKLDVVFGMRVDGGDQRDAARRSMVVELGDERDQVLGAGTYSAPAG